MRRPAPVLDTRDAEGIVADLMRRRTGYTPEWTPVPGGAGWALVQVFAQQMHGLVERMDRAPDRMKLALLDMLGLSLLPAQAARAPVVFMAVPRAPDSTVPARTRVGAKVAGRSDPLIFETDAEIALAAAHLAEVVTVWPGRGGYADHSVAAIGGQPFTLFSPLQPIPHALYLSHDALFALAGHATLEVQFELSALGSAPLSLAWEYWDGQDWRAFKPFKPVGDASAADSLDGTDGLTRSGVVRLVGDCAKTAKKKIGGHLSYWIRARQAQAMPSEPTRVWPRVERIGLRSVVLNPLHRLALVSVKLNPLAPGSGSTVSVQLVGRDEPGTAELVGEGFSTQLPLPAVPNAVAPVLATQFSSLPPGHYRLHVEHPAFAPFDQGVTLPLDTQAEIILFQAGEPGGLEAESAYADGVKLDLSKAFLPFGPIAQAGNSFYLRSADAFARPGARITLTARGVSSSVGSLDVGAAGLAIVAEAWDGEQWRDVSAPPIEMVNLFAGGFVEVEFDLPQHLATTRVQGEEGHWLRIRIAAGGFANVRPVKVNDKDTFNFVEQVPKALEQLRIGYKFRSSLADVQHCLTCNDFDWQDHSADARRQGGAFEPFSPGVDATPTIYLGFDAPLPAGLVSLYFDVQEVSGDADGPPLHWEGWDGSAWRVLGRDDQTRSLALPGMVAIVWPGTPAASPATVLEAKGSHVRLADPRDGPRFLPGDRLFIEREGTGELVVVAASERDLISLATPLDTDYVNAVIAPARLPRFGTPRTWIRARLQQDGLPRAAQLNGLYLNAAWASQLQTFDGEILGSSNGQPDQAFFTRQKPVLPGQVVEVRELDGARAAVELPLLLQDLRAHGMSEADVRTVADRRTGQISAVWVAWQERPHLFFSRPDDRHYVIERSSGRISFGDNQHSRIPAPGADNVMARSYRAGGGLVGNVPALSITQVLAGVLAQAVSNPRAAEGGADAELPQAVLDRGPLTVRHRRQAVSAGDYEALAREASPAVAVARALPNVHPSGRTAAGWVTVIVMPHSPAPRPQPSFELRRQVREFLLARMPASAAGQVGVTGPQYHAVGVVAEVAVRDPRAAGTTQLAVVAALQRFLHPLTGGPEGTGWAFGRDVYISDVAALLESVAGVDHVQTLELTLDGTPRGEVIAVPEARIVVAGPLQVTLAAS